MTSYEIVRSAVKPDSPSPVPVRLGSLGIGDTFGMSLRAGAGLRTTRTSGVHMAQAPSGLHLTGRSWEGI